MLARKYIEKLIKSGQQAIEELNEDEIELTEVDIQKALGMLDHVQHDLEAAKILLREEMKELKKMNK